MDIKKMKKKKKEEIENKKKRLEEVREELKNEFIGIDNCIDEIVDKIEGWYLFPEAQLRPVIINLWGLTGTGKTDLIRKLFQKLNLSENILPYDIGDHTDDSEDFFRDRIADSLKNLKRRTDNNLIFIFDEFQLGRSKNEDGKEIKNSYMRVIWELLDRGEIDIYENLYSLMKLETYHKYISRNISQIEIDDGCVYRGQEALSKHFPIHDFSKEQVSELSLEGFSGLNEKSKNKKTKKLDIIQCIVSHVYNLLKYKDENELEEGIEKFTSSHEVHNFLREISSDKKRFVNFIEKVIKTSKKPTTFSFNKSIIFNIGNLDEAYPMAKNMDPDNDADLLYNDSKKITLMDIKESLNARFRPEQIARLGNNHVIYPSLSSDSYKKIINNSLKNVKDHVKRDFNLDINFKSSITNLIYKEGVFPTQGVRGVFTTVNSIVESNIGNFIYSIIRSNKNIDSLTLSFVKNKLFAEFFSGKEKVSEEKYNINLKLNSFKNDPEADKRIVSSVHEAGHAVCYIYQTGDIPRKLLSKTASSDTGGFCLHDNPDVMNRDHMLKNIVTGLGGKVAEESVFGKNNISGGASSDIDSVTNLALMMTKVNGIDTDISISNTNPNLVGSITNIHRKDEEGDKRAEEIVKECKQKAVSTIDKNYKLLLKMAEYLKKHKEMSPKLIEKYVEKYGTPIKINKDKEKIHGYKDIFESELNNLNDKENVTLKNKDGMKKNSDRDAVLTYGKHKKNKN